MGIKRETLIIGVLCLFVTIPAFADLGWLVAQTDKGQYHTGDTVEISGLILDRGMPEIGVWIYDPDGNILGAYGVEIELDDSFSKTISLDSPFYDKSGTYLIEFNYGKDTDQLTFDVIGSIIPAPEVPETPEIIPQVLALTTDKSKYTDNEFITISGMVSAVGDPTILIGIYDKNDFPTGFYTPQINSDLGFSISFLAKSGVNFKTPGTYHVKAHYGESKETASFEFAKPPKIPKESSQKPAPKPQITIPAPKPQTPQPIPIQKQEPKPVELKPQKPEPIPNKASNEPKQEEPDNLSVEDKQLGELLNEITLNCDYSDYADTILYYDGMGPALMRLCNYEQAISYFDKSLIKEPENVEVITNKATAYSKLGRIDLAIEYYDSALVIKPNYLPALNNKANALAQIGKLEEAITIYNSILDENPTQSVSQDNLQKARETLAEYAKEQTSHETKSISVNHDGMNAKTGAHMVNYDKDSKQTSIIEEIGSIFAGFFGFLS